MPEMRGRKRKAWVVTYDEPRPPYRGQEFGGVEPGQPLAVYDSRLGVNRLLTVVDAFVQSFSRSPEDMAQHLRPARVGAWVAEEQRSPRSKPSVYGSSTRTALP